ncbi:MAG: DUF5110 domain-containing protein [Ruminococcaceae bacterium]|nr:DUF5110 domain-containing protein [Oscillospiraceae bacterium]
MRKFISILLFALLLAFAASAIDIDSADDVLALMNKEGDFADWTAEYTLTTNIDLSDYNGNLLQKPIGTSESTPFKGTFDGDGYKISGISISGGQYSGLFGVLSGTVKNLTVSGSVSSENANDVGGIAGFAYGSASVINCTNECTVSGKNDATGIVGRIKGTDFTISGCINRGEIKGVREAAGIVGYVEPTGTVLITNCRNYGAITLTSTNERAGGIVGATALKGTVKIEKCINYGNVSGTKNVGGIVGIFQGSDSATSTVATRIITECVNKGTITSTVTSGDARVGGVVGWAKNVGCITDSLNEGKVSSSVERIGGFVGGTEGYASIGYCYSRGTVLSAATGEYVGAFGGYMLWKPHLPNYSALKGSGKEWVNTAKYAASVFDTLNTNGKWVNPKSPELACFHECKFGSEYFLGEQGCHTVCACTAVSDDIAHTDTDGNNVCDRCKNSLANELDTVYVSDGSNGDGTSAANALGSLTAAYNALGDDGGEIILVGTVTVPIHAMDSTETAFVEPSHSGKVTVHGENATLLFDGVYQYHLSGDTEFKNITIASADTSKYIDITGRGHELVMGEGLTMRGCDLLKDVLDTKVTLAGGCRDGAFTDDVATMDPKLTVKSGSYYAIRGFHRLQVTHAEGRVTSSGRANITIGGDVHVKYLVAGSGSDSQFIYPAGTDIHVVGDVTVYHTLSLGNQSSEVMYFKTNLYLEDGRFDFIGENADFVTRIRMTEFNIFVNPESEDAVWSYAKQFAGYGDNEDVISPVASATAKTTDLLALQNGVYTYTNGNLRLTVLSDSLVRIEESVDGTFVDADTLMAVGREEFAGTYCVCDTIGDTVVISTESLTVNIPKGSQKATDVRIYDKNENEVYNFFTSCKNAMYSELPMPSDTPDSLVIIDNGIIPPEGGLTYTGNTDAMSGWRRSENLDMYAFVPMGDAMLLRSDFVKLMGRTMLSDIKTLGSWYSKWTTYTADEKLAMIEEYRTRNIPLDMIVIDTEWKNTSTNGNDGDGTGYEVNTTLYPDMEGFLKAANDAGVLVLFNDHTHKTSLKITNPTELEWQTNGILKLVKIGLDGWWYDRNWSYTLQSPYYDVLYNGTIGQVLYTDTMHKYHVETAGDGYPLRTLLLSNTDWIKNTFLRGKPSLIGHRYGIQWTGDIFGDPLCLYRDLENMVVSGAIGSSPYLSSDLGGFNNNDTVSENMFIRWMQFGAFAPVCRVHSSLDFENEHFPWSYGEYSEGIIKNYLHMRYHLMPYYYALAFENYETGLPLARSLDFNYPEYEEAKDVTQYLLGDDILVAPMWSASGEGSYTVPADWFDSGLKASFYRTNASMRDAGTIKGHFVKEIDVDEINFYWNRLAPIAEVESENYAIRFEGSITPDTDCRLGVISDDGTRVYIDGKLFIDGWTPENILQPFVNNSETLEKGKTYEIKVEYFNAAGRGQLYLTYEPIVEEDNSSRDVFIPDGEWIDIFTGEVITGPKTLTVTKGMEQSPIYVRKGAVIPTTEVESPLNGADFENLALNIYGLGEDSTMLYEDDGTTEGYLEGDSRTTDITVSTSGDVTTVVMSAADGDFATDYTARKVTLRVHSDSPITSALVNGATAAVTKIEKDASVTPFANSGASNISDVYEISFTASLDREHTVLFSTSETPLEPDMLLGDIDGDGKVMINDVLLLLKAVANESDCNADMNADGKITLLDVLRLLKAVVA